MGKKIGLALGGGGARGVAHLGVWLRLKELGIPIHCVAGTSIGSIAGATIAAGRVEETLAWCDEPDWKKIPPLMLETKLSTKAISSGARIEKLLGELIGKTDFAGLEMPFAAVATDLNTSEAVVMRSGDLVSAVRASMSIPGVFRPVEREGRVLVDGQLVAPVPVAACRQMGADVVIAVDINPPTGLGGAKPFEKLNIVDVLMGTLMIFNSEMTRRSFEEDKPEVVIRPDVGEIMALDFRNANRIVDIGRAAVGDDLKSTLADLTKEAIS